MELLTQTKRRHFQNCQRYFFHRHVESIEVRFQKGGRRRGSAFGDAIFALAEASRRGEHPDTWPITASLAVAPTYDDLSPDTTEEANELEVERIKVETMAVAYAHRYDFAAGGVPERRELQYELPLRNPWTGYTSRAFRVAGKLDGLIPLSGKRCVVIEDKFVGQISKVMIERLPLDHQVSEYMDALMVKGWTGEVYYRHTLKPGTNPILVGTKKKGDQRRETLDEYAVRLRADVKARPDHYFNEQRLMFGTSHMDDFRHGRWTVAQEILEKRRQAKKADDPKLLYSQTTTRCLEFGGCEFLPLCSKKPGAEDLYVRVEDNPELQKEKQDASE